MRERASWGVTEKERENPRQDPSRLWAGSHEPWDPRVAGLTNWATLAPLEYHLEIAALKLSSFLFLSILHLGHLVSGHLFTVNQQNLGEHTIKFLHTPKIVCLQCVSRNGTDCQRIVLYLKPLLCIAISPSRMFITTHQTRLCILISHGCHQDLMLIYILCTYTHIIGSVFLENSDQNIL